MAKRLLVYKAQQGQQVQELKVSKEIRVTLVREPLALKAVTVLVFKAFRGQQEQTPPYPDFRVLMDKVLQAHKVVRALVVVQQACKGQQAQQVQEHRALRAYRVMTEVPQALAFKECKAQQAQPGLGLKGRKGIKGTMVRALLALKVVRAQELKAFREIKAILVRVLLGLKARQAQQGLERKARKVTTEVRRAPDFKDSKGQQAQPGPELKGCKALVAAQQAFKERKGRQAQMRDCFSSLLPGRMATQQTFTCAGQTGCRQTCRHTN
jgi:hypothetical protein